MDDIRWLCFSDDNHEVWMWSLYLSTPMRYDHLAIHQDEQVSQLDEVSWAQPDSCRENLKGGLFSVCPFGIPSGVLVWHVIQISLIRDQAVIWKHLKNSAWYFFFFFKCIVNHLIVSKEQLNTLLRLNTPPSQIKKRLLLTAWRTESATGSIEFLKRLWHFANSKKVDFKSLFKLRQIMRNSNVDLRQCFPR